MKTALIAILLAGAPVAAMSEDLGHRVMTQAEADGFASLGPAKEMAARKTLESLSAPDVKAALTANLSDVTKIIYQAGYGVFIEYTSADGQDRMWFPGNRGVVKGVWGLREMGGGLRACFHYLNSRNVVTGEFESTECVEAAQELSDAVVLDRRSGDVFKLMSDRIPYRKGTLEGPAWPAAADSKPQP
jgi:hypothetical protein